MLIGIDPLLTPELLMHLSAMGHGEWVAVVDANFTADFLAKGRPLVRLPGNSLERVSRAVLSVSPLAMDVAQPVAFMHVCNSAPAYRTLAQDAVVAYGLQHDALVELPHPGVVRAPHAAGVAHARVGRAGCRWAGCGLSVRHAQTRMTPLQNSALP